MKSRIWVCYLILIIFASMMPISSAIMGYDIIAKIDSTTWELHRTTRNLNFSFDGSISGSGNFSRSANVRDLAGLNADESDYSLNGSIQYRDKIRYVSKEGPVVVNANLQEFVYDDPDEDETHPSILLVSSANIEVNERWPANFGVYKSIRYNGEGLRTNAKYNNNGDIISESFFSQKLSLEDLYKATLNRTYITAKLAPSGVIEKRESNRTSSFALRSESIGPSTHLEFSQNRFYGEGTRFGRSQTDSLISEDYAGHQLINLKVNMSDYVRKPQAEEKIEYLPWLDCCIGGYLNATSNYDASDQGLGSDVRGVFDCTCYKGLT